MAVKRPSPVLPNAMPWPIFEKLKDKRVVLASSSPRRKDILENVVSDEHDVVADNRGSDLRLSPRASQRTSQSPCSRVDWLTIPLPPLAKR